MRAKDRRMNGEGGAPKTGFMLFQTRKPPFPDSGKLPRSFFLIRRIDSAARSSNLGDFPTRLIGSILHANYKSLDGGRQPDAARGVSPTANDCRLSFNPNSGANAEKEEKGPLSTSPIICHTLSLSVRSRTKMILRFLDIKPLVASRKKPTRALPKLRRVPNLSSPSIHPSCQRSRMEAVFI